MQLVGAQLLDRNVQWFRGGLVFKPHRLLYHSTPDLRVIKKKKKKEQLNDFHRMEMAYRGTSLMRKHLPLGPYSRTMPRALWWS